MKEYVSSNGVLMVEGNLINWEKNPIYYGQLVPSNYVIILFDGARCYYVIYDEITHIINIDEVSFFCENLDVAENYVLSHIISTNRNIPPLYSKLNAFKNRQDEHNQYKEKIKNFLNEYEDR